MAMVDKPRPAIGEPPLGHLRQEALSFRFDRLRQQAACPQPQHRRQRVVDGLRLPERDYRAILVHGVSLSLRVSGRLALQLRSSFQM
jgi:hypothetical protein